MGITDYEILRTEKFGSRERFEKSKYICCGCGAEIDTGEDEICEDERKQKFCSEKCFLGYYGYKKLKFGEY